MLKDKVLFCSYPCLQWINRPLLTHLVLALGIIMGIILYVLLDRGVSRW